MKRIVVMASGAGSNFASILQHAENGDCDVDVTALFSDRAEAGALEIARKRNIPTTVLPIRKGDCRSEWNKQVASRIEELEPDLIVLAGFMRILGSPIVEQYRGRILNIHPSLLPAFPGAHAVAEALKAGVCVTGCTVHWVDAGVDTGRIIAQAALPILDDDSVESLHQRIRQVEHRLLPAILDAVARPDGSSRLLRALLEERETRERVLIAASLDCPGIDKAKEAREAGTHRSGFEGS
ncbi:MAG: phosphoribosylglycinamide formyltransferase [Myxococcota bacterium]